jgi:hypothetical protein
MIQSGRDSHVKRAVPLSEVGGGKSAGEEKGGRGRRAKRKRTSTRRRRTARSNDGQLSVAKAMPANGGRMKERREGKEGGRTA